MSDLKIAALSKANLLVGRVLQGSYEQKDMNVGGRTFKADVHNLSKEEEENIKKEIEWDNVRFILYGYIYTQEFRMDRINVRVEKDMSVSGVYVG